MSASNRSCQDIQYPGIVSIMARARPFLWLIALFAFVVPALGLTSAGHAPLTFEQASTECPEHSPPPDSCPAGDAAKHAVGECCPAMSQPLALLQPVADVDATVPFQVPATKSVPDLAGHVFAKDPPPPRG